MDTQAVATLKSAVEPHTDRLASLLLRLQSNLSVCDLPGEPGQEYAAWALRSCYRMHAEIDAIEAEILGRHPNAARAALRPDLTVVSGGRS